MYLFIVLLTIVALLLTPFRTQAQAPVVYGVFFYSPTCPHCHEVIDNHWPAIQSEFGDQLRVLFVDASQRSGGQLMTSALQAMGIQSNGVPMLIIGREVLVGSRDIPLRAPVLIRAGLEAGGIGYPPIPGIEAEFQAARLDTPVASQRSLLDDPANLAALVVLAGLLAVLVVMAAMGWSLVTHRTGKLIAVVDGVMGRRMVLLGALVGVLLAGSLFLGSFNDPITLVLSLLVLSAFGFVAYQLFYAKRLTRLPDAVFPLIVVAGLLVAGYLAYVETTQNEATCGIVGNCNAVQQSEYAQVMGVPVGVIGIVGYGALLLLWYLRRTAQMPTLDIALFALALVGVGFSTYLTFLEPFVIGSSCVWCLLSAVVMGVVLWLTVPAGWKALQQELSLDHRQAGRGRRL
jgi:uncharacterized membrane protein/thiol-disulfide isomerase/thioredoxin